MSKFHHTLNRAGLAALAVVVGLSASGFAKAEDMPTVKMMVGGISKQIYLPYTLAQSLGLYKKYGVNVELLDEVEGGVGAEDAVVSGQVEFAGAWYVHAIDFQTHGKRVIGVVQMSSSPGERIMCVKGSGIKSAADWKGKTIGVTDLGSGTDDLVRYLASRSNLTTKDFSRLGVGAGATLIAAMKFGKVDCAITTQPTVNAVIKLGLGESVVDLATGDGVQKALGGYLPTAGLLARGEWVDKNKETTQKVVNALVETMHWINTHSAADIADKLPKDFVSNKLSTREEYINALATDKSQFLPDGMMPEGGPKTVLDELTFAGKVKGKVDLPATYTNEFVVVANKTLGLAK